MFLGAAKVILDFYGNIELSAKHAAMKTLANDAHRKLNVSAREITEKVDDPERCVLGLAVVASNEKDARSAIDAALKFVDAHAFARVTSEDVEFYQFD